jgi:imidazole glycerol-phosphate synthase subunit HisF
MLRPRIIPSLLIHEGGLVKTVSFKAPKYVGDPINAVKIFNEKECDELAVFDIDASVLGRDPDFKLIADLAAESRMPLAYGGGVRSAAQAKRIIGLGVEKVCVSAAALDNPALVSQMAQEVGSQSVVVVLDHKKRAFGKEHDVFTHNGKHNTKRALLETALDMQERGAGEIIINGIDDDGHMKGYNTALAVRLRQALRVPLTVLGGAGSLADVEALVQACGGIVGAAAGSLFVFKGSYRAVLINYPNPAQRDLIALNAQSAQSK